MHIESTRHGSIAPIPYLGVVIQRLAEGYCDTLPMAKLNNIARNPICGQVEPRRESFSFYPPPDRLACFNTLHCTCLQQVENDGSM